MLSWVQHSVTMKQKLHFICVPAESLEKEVMRSHAGILSVKLEIVEAGEHSLAAVHFSAQCLQGNRVPKMAQVLVRVCT